ELLAELVRENLEDDATAVVSVPAWTGLYGRHDVQLNHHRRYAPAEAAALLQDAGLAIVRRGGLFHSLLLPRYLTKALRWHGRSTVERRWSATSTRTSPPRSPRWPACSTRWSSGAWRWSWGRVWPSSGRPFNAGLSDTTWVACSRRPPRSSSGCRSTTRSAGR